MADGRVVMSLYVAVLAGMLLCGLLPSCGSDDSRAMEEQILADAKTSSDSGEEFTVKLEEGTTGAFLLCPYTSEASLPDDVRSAVDEENVDLRQDGAQYIVSATEDGVVDVAEVRSRQGVDFCTAEEDWSSPYWYEFEPDQSFRAVESETSADVYEISRT